MSDKKLQLKVGGTYVRRDGPQVTIIRPSNDDRYPFEDSDGDIYTATGKFIFAGPPHSLDIIAEVEFDDAKDKRIAELEARAVRAEKAARRHFADADMNADKASELEADLKAAVARLERVREFRDAECFEDSEWYGKLTAILEGQPEAPAPETVVQRIGELLAQDKATYTWDEVSAVMRHVVGHWLEAK